ncbi:MAG TPA: histidine kinase dimerization/phospho-acceptor domain-containing protein [Anaerolineae bacterium]
MYAEAQQRAGALAAALSRQEELDNLKNRFIHGVSHELRTPLGIIYGHAELLDSGDLGELSPEQAQSVQIIARRAQMLTNLVNDWISAEKLPRIFERLYQVEGNATRHTGTGLGLALVKEIVEAHRGHISVTSEVARGTTFRIVLPGQSRLQDRAK